MVRVVTGEVFDVAVDIRKESETFGLWHGEYLSESNKKQLWVPPGFAHGFLVLSDEADFEYKCSSFYNPMDEGCIVWNDPDINISWPIENPKLSQKIYPDSYLKTLSYEGFSSWFKWTIRTFFKKTIYSFKRFHIF